MLRLLRFQRNINLKQIKQMIKYNFFQNNDNEEILENIIKIDQNNDEDQDQQNDNINNKYYRQNFVMFPSYQTLFPQNSMVMRINPLVYEYLIKENIEYVGIFTLKDQDKKKEIQLNIKQIQSSEQEQEIQNKIQQKNRHFFKQKKEAIKKKLYAEIESQDMKNLDKFHQNIIYDENVDENNIGNKNIKVKLVKNLEEIYDIGTLCKLQLSKIEIEEEQQIMMGIAKGIERVKITRLLENQREKIKEGRDEIELESVDEVAEIVNFVQVEQWKTLSQGIMEDWKYIKKHTELIKTFGELKQKVRVNVPELIFNLQDFRNIDILCGYLALSSYLSREQKQELLQIQDIRQRVNQCLIHFQHYLHKANTQFHQLYKNNLPVTTETHQKQMQDIYQYLLNNHNHNPNQDQQLIINLQNKITNRNLPETVLKLLTDKIEELKEMNFEHPEYGNKKQLIDMILELPYGQQSQDNFNLKEAAEILDKEHFGMKEVKERILEMMAVGVLRESYKGKVLLLYGPPGVGKTSIGQSIAHCLKRKFGRISLGGESDVAVIKGHRKTYMGAYPGKIVQLLRTLKVENPVILLDEIDKTGQGVRGNISDALLEVLDSEQNNKFVDHYLEVPVDLSKVLFLCSANLLDSIPSPLLDRMEIIQIRGYTFQEKFHIAKQYLLPRAIADTALLHSPYYHLFSIPDPVLSQIILDYSRESGVRSLQRQLLRICEQAVYNFMIQSTPTPIHIQSTDLIEYLGMSTFQSSQIYNHSQLPVGVIIGLAYNSYGGSIIYLESMAYNKGVGSIKLTGQLGEVMSESVQIAYSFMKELLEKQSNTFLNDNQIHIHFPEGATPKDGPSAGIAIASSLYSLSINKPIQVQVAMTGEISLTGKVLKIGGVKEKVLAAKREAITNIILPQENQQDINELESDILQSLTFHYVSHFSQVVQILYPSH